MEISGKKELRKHFMEIRNGIKRSSREAVWESLKENPRFKKAKKIFCYVSAGSEPDTWLLMEEILKSGKTLAVPKCLDKKGNMEAVEIKSFSELKPGYFGIMEPEDGRMIEKPEIDLCIVPGLSFDRESYRLGYGGGYYDRFLFGSEIYSVGICFKELYKEKLPRETNDISVNEVVVV